MANCFDNLVGVKTKCGTYPESFSKLYIQDLPFINLKLADAIVTDQNSGYQLLLDKVNSAAKYVVGDAQTRMNPYFKYHSVIENQVAGYYYDNMPLIDGIDGSLVGMQMKIVEYPYLSVFINSISLFIDQSGEKEIYIYDLTQSKLLDTITITAVANEIVTIDVNKEYFTNGRTLNLFVCYNSTGVNNYQGNVFNPSYPGILGCKGCKTNRAYNYRMMWLSQKSVPAGLQKIESNLVPYVSTGGLSLIYTVSCSIGKWMCTNRNRFGMALLHRAGMEVIKEYQVSNRINSLVTLKQDEAQTLYEYFEAEYNKAMDNAMKNLNLPNDICLQCNKRLQTGFVAT